MALMTKDGFKPTQTTFNLMVLMFACVGDTQKMEAYFQEMKKNGLVRVVTYFTAIFGFLAGREFDKAMEYLEVLRTIPGYKPSNHLFTLMTKVLEHHKQKELLEKLKLIMKADKPEAKVINEEDLPIDEEAFKQMASAFGPDRFL